MIDKLVIQLKREEFLCKKKILIHKGNRKFKNRIRRCKY